MVRPAEPAVDHQQAPVRANGFLALARMHRRMPVDDMPIPRHHTEFRQDGIADGRVVGQREIRIHGLHPCCGIVDIGALERLDMAPARRRFHPDPQVPHPVEGIGITLAPGTSSDLVAKIEIVPTATPRAQTIHGRESPVIVHRHAAVEQQVTVAHQVHSAVAVEKLDMTTQVIGSGKLRHQLVDDMLLGLGQLVGMLRVHRGEISRR